MNKEHNDSDVVCGDAQLRVGAFYSNTLLIVAARPTVTGFIDFWQVRLRCVHAVMLLEPNDGGAHRQY